MTESHSKKKKKRRRSPFRVRRWFAPVELPEYFIPPKLAQYLLSSTASLVSSVLKDEKGTVGVVAGKGFWYLPDKTDQVRPLIVAHVDTVCKTTPRHLKLDKEMVYNPEGILGADDRAGVYAAHMLRKETGVAVLLCDDEESGAWGARAAAKTIGDLIKAHPYMIELDRQGHREVVYYRDECDAFRQHFESYGFTKCYGSFSDISVLSRELDLPGANLSVGFHWQHSKDEWLDLRSLSDTITRTTQLINENKTVVITPVVSWQSNYFRTFYPPVKETKLVRLPSAPIVRRKWEDVVDLDEIGIMDADEVDAYIAAHMNKLSLEQIDHLTAIQIEKLEQEKQDAIDDAKIRQLESEMCLTEQRDDVEKLYDWWRDDRLSDS